MKLNKIHLLSRLVALVSFIIGSILFVAFQFMKMDWLYIPGIYFVAIATVVNVLMLFVLVLMIADPASDVKQIAISIGILFSNVPICAIYLYTVIMTVF
jgi:hypothetical protein